MSIDVKEVIDDSYGNCVEISNGSIRALVTIDYGPEIVFFGKENGENLLEPVKYLESDGLVKGHSLWISEREYIPQKLPVVYSLTKDGASFSTVIMPNKDLKLSMSIIMNNDSQDMMLIHSVKSLYKDDCTLSISSRTCIAKNGITVIPQSSSSNSDKANRVLAFWPYSKINDPRLCLTDKYIKIYHNIDSSSRFKLGINDCDGWILHVNNGTAFAQRFVHNEKALYPHFGTSVSVYTDNEATVVDTFSPMYDLQNKDIVNHVESWSVFDTQEKVELKCDKDIDELLSSLE